MTPFDRAVSSGYIKIAKNYIQNGYDFRKNMLDYSN